MNLYYLFDKYFECDAISASIWKRVAPSGITLSMRVGFILSATLCAVAQSAHGNDWMTISPAPASVMPVPILPQQPLVPGRCYVLAWDMRVEGEKTWRFRASFAGMNTALLDARGDVIESIERHTSCWQTLDWQRAWICFYAPENAAALSETTMRIVSDERLPGRFRVRNVRLIDWDTPPDPAPGNGRIQVRVTDESGNPADARIYVVDASGRGHTPEYSYAYTQGTRCFHVTDPALARIEVPAGTYSVSAMKGFEHRIARETVNVVVGRTATAELALKRAPGLGISGWISGDHHTHLFRHGSSLYPMINFDDVLSVARGEGLDYLPFMGVDTGWLHEPESDHGELLVQSTHELTRDFWGHICPIGISGLPRLEDRGNAFPMNMDWIKAVRDQGGAVAYAHPYGPLRKGEEFAALESLQAGLIAREFPIDVAMGLPCTIDILAKEDARGEFDLKRRDYMRLLNLGFRTGVSGSTDFHLDQGREPIGGFRTYVYAPQRTWTGIATAFNEGRTFASNGPLIDLRVAGRISGETIELDSPGSVQVKVVAGSLWGVDSVEIWRNGALTRAIKAREGRVQAEFPIEVEQSGWLLAIAKGRAVPEVMTTPEGKPCVNGQFAMTSPVYIQVTTHPVPPDPDSAQYFLDWIDAVQRGFETACEQAVDALTDDLRQRVLERLESARAEFRKRAR